MVSFSLPRVILFLPFLGAFFLLFVRGTHSVVSKNSRNIALLVTASIFLLSLMSVFLYTNGSDIFIGRIPIRLLQPDRRITVDALSMIFILLISFLTLLSVSTVRRHITFSIKEFTFLILIAQCFMLNAVCSTNMFRFFVFMQSSMVPLFLMIAIWGTEKRMFTAYKFCFFDLMGNIFFMPVLLMISHKTGSVDFSSVQMVVLTHAEQTMLFVCMMFALAFKAPLFPFHAWLSDAQSEAPVPAGILLCGLFTKLIFYAFLRLAFPTVETVLQENSTLLLYWAAFCSVYGALITLKQTDIRKIAGFSHLSQVGFLAAGVFCSTTNALSAVLFLCMAQGLSVTAYIMSAGALSSRLKTAEIKDPTGLMNLFPYLGTTFFISCLIVLAVPPLMPFTGQFLIFYNVFQQSKTVVFFLLLSVILLYTAFFKLFTRLLFGEAPQKNPCVSDMSWREKTATVVFGVVFLFLSLMPKLVFNLVEKVW